MITFTPQLMHAITQLGIAILDAARAQQDFNAQIMQLPDGRVITAEQLANVEPPIRRIRL